MEKSDKKVIIAALFVAVSVLTIQFVAGGVFETPAQSECDTLAETQSGMSHKDYNRKQQTYYVAPRKLRLVDFDPNEADSNVLLGLGLQPYQVRSIYRYRAAGGVFRQPSDFTRVYGLTVKQYRKLKPYIRISSDYLPASTIQASERAVERHDFYYSPKVKTAARVDLCMADSAALTTIPGIGPYFARQILNYGKRLGGYVRVEQLCEIENFPDTAIRYFVLSSTTPRRLNFNKMSLAELKRHPYMGFYRAKAVTEYRRLKGRISGWQALSVMKEFDKESIRRLEPYVNFEE